MAATATLKAKLTLNDSAFSAGFRKAKGIALNFGATLATKLRSVATGPLAALGGAIAGAFTAKAFADGIKGVIDLAGSLVDLKAQTGEDVDQLLIFQQVLAANGVEAEAARGILNRLQKTISEAGDGSSSAAGEFRDLGLNIRDLQKLGPVGQFRALAAAIGKIPDPARKAATAMQIFGKSGGALLSVFSDTEGFEIAARSLGRQTEILKGMAEDLDTVGDRLGRAGLKLQGFFVGATSKLLPALLKFTEIIDQADFSKWGEQFGAAMMGGVKFLVGVFMKPELILGAFQLYLIGIGVQFGEAIAAGAQSAAKGSIKSALESFIKFSIAASPLGGVLNAVGGANSLEKLLRGPDGKPKASAEFFSGASNLVQKIKDAAAEWFKVQEEAKKKEPARTSGVLSNNGGLRGATMSLFPNGMAEFFSLGNRGRWDSSLSRKAYNSTPLLSARERRSIEDAAVARGDTRRASSFGAFGAIRRGDSERRKEVEREKLKKAEGVDKSNELLGGIDKKLTGFLDALAKD